MLSTVGRHSHSDANPFASLQDVSGSPSSEADPGETESVPLLPPDPGLARRWSQSQSQAEVIHHVCTGQQVPPQVFDAMGLPCGSFADQKVTISSVPSTAADGTVTKICKLVLERGGGASSELLAP